MRVPVQVEVGGKKIRIRYLKTLPGPAKDVTFGEFCPQRCEIKVNKSVHHNAAEVHHTVVHEIFHTVFKLSGLENIIPLAKEEAIVSALENMTAPLFIFNPNAKVTFREVRFPFEEDDE
jgi:hypothetical protein